MCDCVNVEIGSYDNQVVLPVPEHMRPLRNCIGDIRESICVDRCVAEEVQSLWSLGIVTTGCCCGHNKMTDRAFIGVMFEDIERMKEMGYVVQPNKSRPGDEDEFVPKTDLRSGNEERS